MRDAVHNAKAAVRFVRKNAERFGVDAAHIAVWGSLGPWNSVGRGLLLGVSETGGTFEGVLIYHICRGDDRVPDFLKRS